MIFKLILANVKSDYKFGYIFKFFSVICMCSIFRLGISLVDVYIVAPFAFSQGCRVRGKGNTPTSTPSF